VKIVGEMENPRAGESGVALRFPPKSMTPNVPADGLRLRLGIGNPAASAYAFRMAEPFRHPHRVTYAECTIGDHIYHARYLDLLEAARGEFLRALGAPVLGLQDADYIFPVIEARLRYKAPARYDDLLTIEVWLTLVERVRLNFGHRIVNQAGKLLLEAETFHCCTSRDEKPRRLPPELVEKLRPYLVK
jgi:acyl-CoA thioester hydrolase